MPKNQFDFVVDCSITMAWCFEDESNSYTEKILEKLKSSTAVVPTIWPLEIPNVLLGAKKKKRISEVQSALFIEALSALPITIDPSTSSRAMLSISTLAFQEELTIYDAAI